MSLEETLTKLQQEAGQDEVAFSCSPEALRALLPMMQWGGGSLVLCGTVASWPGSVEPPHLPLLGLPFILFTKAGYAESLVRKADRLLIFQT